MNEQEERDARDIAEEIINESHMMQEASEVAEAWGRLVASCYVAAYGVIEPTGAPRRPAEGIAHHYFDLLWERAQRE